MEKITLAMAGFGGIGRIHHLALSDLAYFYPGVLPSVELKGVCASTPERSRRAAEDAGLAVGYENYDALLADPDVDVVVIVSPNNLHKEQILKALAAGKHVLCEKPLAVNGAEAREIETAAVKSGVKVGMIFNYRFVPAILKAKELIDAGRIGDIYSFRGEYYHTGYQNPQRPFSWRMDMELSGGGALMDLGVHVIDLVRYLLGDFARVKADMKTFIKERPLPGDTSGTGKVTVDDAAWMQCELSSGAPGSIEVSRFATGTLDDLNLSVYGSRGSLKFSLMDPGFLSFFDEAEKGMGWNRLETVTIYPGAKIPNPRTVPGWSRFHSENYYRFLKSLADGSDFSPALHDGAAAQYILDAAYRSAETGRMEDVV